MIVPLGTVLELLLFTNFLYTFMHESKECFSYTIPNPSLHGPVWVAW